jgi:nicotinamide-nucleotide amidase
MQTLIPLAEAIAGRLKASRQTVAVAESSSGGLISAALLAVPGASAYFLGGGVIYTARARHRLLGLGREATEGMRSASPPYALLLAETVRERLDATWGLSETGAAGPAGNGYGDAAGHCCMALAGPISLSRSLETELENREENMRRFAAAALRLLLDALDPSKG